MNQRFLPGGDKYESIRDDLQWESAYDAHEAEETFRETVRQYVESTLEAGGEPELYDFCREYGIRELTGREEAKVIGWFDKFESEWRELQPEVPVTASAS